MFKHMQMLLMGSRQLLSVACAAKYRLTVHLSPFPLPAVLKTTAYICGWCEQSLARDCNAYHGADNAYRPFLALATVHLGASSYIAPGAVPVRC